MNRKRALMYCHRKLVKSGMFFLALALLRYLQGNQTYISSAATALRTYSTELNELNLL